MTGTRRSLLMTLAWLWVGVPFAYGVYQLILKVVQLFGG
ncbi:MFS transporter small subunit [Amycolatopsis pigmentata]